jgi:peptidoglycan/xylan/chitin deacetylase (PgdA/CDA1 family)
MNANLWSQNHPRNFWHCHPDPPGEIWQNAIEVSLPILGLDSSSVTLDSFLELSLGESRFGPNHWRLSLPKRMYYILKPLLPRVLTRFLRQHYQNPKQVAKQISWPIEDHYVKFLWNVLAEVLKSVPNVKPAPLWPDGHRFAFILTHDVEDADGQKFIPAVADLEEEFGFRSSFNFVPERYPIDLGLVDELRQRGFEIGIHGLKHDGKLFSSRKEFERRAARINQYLREFDAVGFRSPLTHRNPEWMQALNIEYDLSFFDADPFEPIPGGTMNVYPFFIGHFVELPYTLVQDYTLTAVLNQHTPNLWLDKVEFLREVHGMVLLNSHPDYLKSPENFRIYSAFLSAMHIQNDAWHALPRDAACWWRVRTEVPVQEMIPVPV